VQVRLSDPGESYLMVEDYYTNGRTWPEPDQSEPEPEERDARGSLNGQAPVAE
jgi:hypothetical protein